MVRWHYRAGAGGVLGDGSYRGNGLRRCIWPLVITMHLPDLFFVYMAWEQPSLRCLSAGCTGAVRLRMDSRSLRSISCALQRPVQDSIMPFPQVSGHRHDSPGFISAGSAKGRLSPLLRNCLPSHHPRMLTIRSFQRGKNLALIIHQFVRGIWLGRKTQVMCRSASADLNDT